MFSEIPFHNTIVVTDQAQLFSWLVDGSLAISDAPYLSKRVLYEFESLVEFPKLPLRVSCTCSHYETRWKVWVSAILPIHYVKP